MGGSIIVGLFLGGGITLVIAALIAAGGLSQLIGVALLFCLATYAVMAAMAED